MIIEGAKNKGIFSFSINGKLDFSNVSKAEKTIWEWLAQGELHFTGDLSGLDYISSAGLSLLLKLYKEVKSRGGVFVIHGLNSMIRNIMEIAGFEELIPICGDAETAVEMINNTLTE